MRVKTDKVVFSFNVTGMVMHLEELCKGKPELGRIIPTPSALSAGCGMSWAAEAGKKEELLELMKMALNIILSRFFQCIKNE